MILGDAYDCGGSCFILLACCFSDWIVDTHISCESVNGMGTSCISCESVDWNGLALSFPTGALAINLEHGIVDSTPALVEHFGEFLFAVVVYWVLKDRGCLQWNEEMKVVLMGYSVLNLERRQSTINAVDDWSPVPRTHHSTI